MSINRLTVLKPARPTAMLNRAARFCGRAWPASFLAVLICFASARNAGAAELQSVPAKDPTDLSLEELINIKVTSVGKKETSLMNSPAAVAVLTADDIRRMGATSIPEALRAVPGLDVARISADRWAISSRGFNDEYSNKLLVLVDGRSVYTPTFGGVYWNVQDLVLQDLDRIEVVRGPGGTLWGANAVNGVINIITKSAKETQGALLSASYGTEDQPSASARYGASLSSNLFYRVYVKYYNREGFEDSAGRGMADDSSMTRGGARLDWEPGEQNTFTLSGDYYGGTYGEQVGKSSLFPPSFQILGIQAPNSGGNVLGRWTDKFSEDSELKLQVYYDWYERDHPFGGGVLVAAPNEFVSSQNVMHEQRDTWDLDLQYRFALGTRQDIVCGAGYRYTRDDIHSGGTEIFWTTVHGHDNLASAFVQDEITAIPERLRFTIGTKLEHNDFTGIEVEPGARVLWTPVEHQSYWASIARAVRTPTRLERDARINLATFTVPPATPGLVSQLPNQNAASETLLAYELGWRFEPAPHLSFDLATFYNDYELLASVPTAPGLELNPAPPHVLQAYNYTNDISGHTYGAELLAQWQPMERWRLTAGFTWLHTAVDGKPATSRTNPEYQFNLRSSYDLGRGWEVNGAMYYVDHIQSVPEGTTSVRIPAYVRVDLGLSWRPNDHWELSVWGQNLLDAGHPEFASYKTPNIAQIPRTFYGTISWRF